MDSATTWESSLAQGVVAAESVVDVGRAVLQERLVVLVVDALEVPRSNALDDGVVAWATETEPLRRGR